MRKAWMLIISGLLLSSTTVTAQGFWPISREDPRVINRAKAAITLKKRMCTVQEKVLGLPITFTEQQKAALREKMGEEWLKEFIIPLVKANLAHRCMCEMDPNLRLAWGCGV